MIFQLPKFDWAKQGVNALSMLLQNSLQLYGLKATVYRAQNFDNGYEPYQYATETTINPMPIKEIRVLLSQPTEGLQLSDFISLSDKVTEQITVITGEELKIDDQLQVQFPDNKTMNLLIIENWAFHAASSLVYRYKARVT